MCTPSSLHRARSSYSSIQCEPSSLEAIGTVIQVVTVEMPNMNSTAKDHRVLMRLGRQIYSAMS